MQKALWRFFLEAVWPLLWPIFRDLMTDIAQDIASWIKRVLAEKFDASAGTQEQRARDKASEAEARAQQATSDDDRIRAEAEAKTWKEVAEQLRSDNAKLRQELDEVVKQSQVYARKRIASEAERDKAQERVLSLKGPSGQQINQASDNVQN